MQAAIDKDKADLEHAKAEFDRSQSLYNEHLLAKQDFDMRKYAYEAQQATVRQSEMRLVQARAQREQTAAQLASAQRRIAQAKANLVRFNDLLKKHNVYCAARWRGYQPARAGRRDGGTRRPELRRQHHHDHRGHVADHLGSEGGRDRHRQREAGSGGGRDHRRYPQQDIQGTRDRDRQYGDPAFHRRGRQPERHFQPGSQGFQGGGRTGQPRPTKFVPDFLAPQR